MSSLYSEQLSSHIERQLAALSKEEAEEQRREKELLLCHNKTMLRNQGLALYNCLIEAVDDCRWTIRGLSEQSSDDNITTSTLTSFRRGDPVLIEFSKSSVQAKILKISKNSFVVSVQSTDDRDGNAVELRVKPSTPIRRIIKTTNPTSIKRQKDSLKQLLKMHDRNFLKEPASEIISLLFGKNDHFSSGAGACDVVGFNDLRIGDDKIIKTTTTQTTSLNQEQRNILYCSDKKLLLLHGPPGTGKTECLVKLIETLANNLSEKRIILVCGPSNQSVDNVLERLALPFMIRMGNSSKFYDSSIPLSLDSHLKRENGSPVVEEIKKEISTLGRKEKMSWKDTREIRNLRGELHKREAGLEESFKERIKNTKGGIVVFSTLNSVLSSTFARIFGEVVFDIAIVDEAAQSIEAESWIPIIKTSKSVILSGDHKQLPPTILTENSILKESLFEKLMKNKNVAVSLLSLKRQYRMNSIIMRWASMEMYSSSLEADPSVKEHILKGLSGVKESEDTEAVFILYDTTGFEGADYGEFSDGDGDLREFQESKSNLGEAKLIVKHCRSLLGDGVLAEQIGIITPYTAQVNLIKQKLVKAVECGSAIDELGIEVGTVDGFQGREKEAILISFVRSNDQHNIGFMEEIRRTNVAITRARRHCCIVANCATFERNKFYSRLFDYICDEGELRFPE